ncbi:Uncharacterised protein [Citrobacter koseri]|nr:Uncharacterised protein [Citrobacter koseri]
MPLPEFDRGIQRRGLTQTQLEDQRFSFAGEDKVDVQTHAFSFFGKGWM